MIAYPAIRRFRCPYSGDAEKAPGGLGTSLHGTGRNGLLSAGLADPFDWHSDRPLRVLCLLICGALFLYMAATGNPVGPWRHENPKLTRVASFMALALIIALGVLVGRALNGGLLGVTAGLAVVTIGTLAILLGGVLVVRRRTRA